MHPVILRHCLLANLEAEPSFQHFRLQDSFESESSALDPSILDPTDEGPPPSRSLGSQAILARKQHRSESGILHRKPWQSMSELPAIQNLLLHFQAWCLGISLPPIFPLFKELLSNLHVQFGSSGCSRHNVNRCATSAHQARASLPNRWNASLN